MGYWEDVAEDIARSTGFVPASQTRRGRLIEEGSPLYKAGQEVESLGQLAAAAQEEFEPAIPGLPIPRGFFRAGARATRGAFDWLTKAPRAGAAAPDMPAEPRAIDPTAPSETVADAMGRAADIGMGADIGIPGDPGVRGGPAAQRKIEGAPGELNFAWGGATPAPVRFTPGEGSRNPTLDLSDPRYGKAPADYRPGRGGYVIPTQPAYIPEEVIEGAEDRARLASVQRMIADPYAQERAKSRRKIEEEGAIATARARAGRDVEEERASDYVARVREVNDNADRAVSSIQASGLSEEEKATKVAQVEKRRGQFLEEIDISTKVGFKREP